MAPRDTPSYSQVQKWTIGFRVCLLTLIVTGVLSLLNYLSREYYRRVHLSASTKLELSSRTVHYLKSLTNRVKVTIYYDKSDPLYSTLADLLKEYQVANPRITVRTVDYLRDAGAAQKVKAAYQLTGSSDKNLVIFEAEAGRWKAVDGKALAQYTLEQIPHEKEGHVRRKPVAFLGEMAFTAALLDVTNPKPLNAYFLQGHREHDIESGDEVTGYLNFTSLLKQNYIRVGTLSLVGTNTIPADCNLLIIAGPLTPIPAPELEKITAYLSQGGRLLALLNSSAIDREIGIESVLARWGVAIGNRVLIDPEHSQYGSDVIISGFSKHPLVNPLLGTGLYLIRPRPIGKLAGGTSSAEAPRVDEVAFTGPNAFLAGEPARKRQFPVMATVERLSAREVVSERGNTRILVIGDSLLFANSQLELVGNRDFAGYAANWLLERSQLLGGVGPRPIKEHKVVMTRSQAQAARWLLLAAMPGAVMAVGGLVWFRRRR